MNQVLESLGQAVLDFYLEASVLLSGAGLAGWWIRQPIRRLALAWSIWVGLLALVVLVAVPSWPRVRVVAGAAEPGGSSILVRAHVGQPAQVRTDQGAIPASQLKASERAVAQSRPDQLPPTGDLVVIPSWPTELGAGFGLGAALMSGWLILGACQIRALRSRCGLAPGFAVDRLTQLVPPGINPPALLVSATLPQPLAVGFWRPTIVLPVNLIDPARTAELDLALTHEWAHIRHRDLAMIALIRVLLPVLYAHPAYWWLRRRVRLDQEAVADAATANRHGRLAYAATLLAWTRAISQSPRISLAAVGAVALFERPSELKRRIMWLLDRRFAVETSCSARWRLGTRVVMGAGVLGLSCLSVRPAIQAQDPATPVLPQPGSAPRTISILLPDGRPAAGAEMFEAQSYQPFPQMPIAARRVAAAGPDGRLTYGRPGPDQPATRPPDLAVVAAGFGPVFIPHGATGDQAEYRLVADDVPLTGEVRDAQGLPVAGATVQVVGILWSPTGTLDEFLARLEAEKAAFAAQYATLKAWHGDHDSFLPRTTTDRSGRFSLRGIGHERIAQLLVEGPGIATSIQYAATRVMAAQRNPDFARQVASREVVYQGTPCVLTAAPDIEVTGTVTDQERGRPIAGIRVETAALFGNPMRTLSSTSDSAGRYRLAGMPVTTDFGEAQELLATNPGGIPYVPAICGIESSDTTQPIKIDIQLRRGVEVLGQVIDRATGAGVKAQLSYYILSTNPNLNIYPRYGTINAGMPFSTDSAGKFRIVALPGPGIIAARAGDERFRLGVGLETTGLAPKPNGANELYETYPSQIIPHNYNTVTGINPGLTPESIAVKVELDPGRKVAGTVLDPTGQPLAGAWIVGLRDDMGNWTKHPMTTAEFVVEGLGRSDSRRVVVVHEEKKLAGSVVVGPEVVEPISVRLEPAGTLTGRIVDPAGQPVVGVEMTAPSMHERIRTDAAGRFRAAGLAPGLPYIFEVWVGAVTPHGSTYQLIDSPNLSVGSGEVRDLGNLPVQRPR